MARLARLSLAGCVHHCIQRGHNGQPVFVDTQDRQAYLAALQEFSAAHGVAVHAYVLMDAHVHLLLTPSSTQGISRMLQAMGRRYVRYFNNRHGRSGGLWEGRFRCTVLQDCYLLPCMVHLDLHPVRAGLVARAPDYAWSSHGHYAGARQDRWIAPHPLYWALGNTPFAREAAYSALVEQGIGTALQRQLADAALRGWALGDEDFVRSLQSQTPRRLARARAGRPRTGSVG
ncbi:MAG: transposase [Rhodoferax sp.]